MLMRISGATNIKRADCTGSEYTTPNGLIFQTGCTNGPNVSSQISETEEDSAEECMNRCAITRPPCYAASYADDSRKCWLLDRSSPQSNETSDDWSNLAQARSSQLENTDNLDCPYERNSLAGRGEFQVLCNVDLEVEAGDYYADNLGEWQRPPHADTFDDCLEL